MKFRFVKPYVGNEVACLFQERSGPKLESEELSLRGNEQKYLGSLNQKSFLNV